MGIVLIAIVAFLLGYLIGGWGASPPPNLVRIRTDLLSDTQAALNSRVTEATSLHDGSAVAWLRLLDGDVRAAIQNRLRT